MLREINKNQKDFETKLEEISILEKKTFGVSAYSFAMLKEISENKQYKFWIKEENKKMTSYLIALDNIDSYDILKIAIKIEYRGKGIGEKFIEKITDKNIFLEVRESNLRAIKFYEKNNFIKISERKNYYKDNSENAIIMMREAREEYE